MRNILMTSVRPLFAAETETGAALVETQAETPVAPAAPDATTPAEKPEWSENDVTEALKNVTANTKSQFQDALTRFIAATATSMEMAILCVKLASEHFVLYGDVVYFQQFDDACTHKARNYVRRAALRAYVEEFFPILVENNKYRKDKDRANKEGWDANKAAILELALKVSFWDFKPEKDPAEFTADDFRKAMYGLINKFRGEKQKPADEDAIEAVNAAEKAVKMALGKKAAVEGKLSA